MARTQNTRCAAWLGAAACALELAALGGCSTAWFETGDAGLPDAGRRDARSGDAAAEDSTTDVSSDGRHDAATEAAPDSTHEDSSNDAGPDSGCDGGPSIDWDEWPIPNSAVDVEGGAPNLESYTDNGDGTVTDNLTGLMWQQSVATTSYFVYSDALVYCGALSLGGHCGWRVPSEAELFSIVDVGQYSPSINTTYFPATPLGTYWSSTLSAGSPDQAWCVDFLYNGGTALGNAKGGSPSYYVRCVR
jgi:Protein of unknown function (DUF1566)